MNPIEVFVETGKKKTFAGAVDWPGWCRGGRDEAGALQALVDYGPRYARVLHGPGVHYPVVHGPGLDFPPFLRQQSCSIGADPIGKCTGFTAGPHGDQFGQFTRLGVDNGPQRFFQGSF